MSPVDEGTSLPPAPPLHLLFASERLCDAGIFLAVKQSDGQPGPRVGGPEPVVVLSDPLQQVPGAPDIVSPVGALKNVHVRHEDNGVR